MPKLHKLGNYFVASVSLVALFCGNLCLARGLLIQHPYKSSHQRDCSYLAHVQRHSSALTASSVPATGFTNPNLPFHCRALSRLRGGSLSHDNSSGAGLLGEPGGMTSFTKLGQKYSFLLQSAPIRTKSLTAGILFALSDYCAQRIEQQRQKQRFNRQQANKQVDIVVASTPTSWSRVLVTGSIGLFYFGPAAHYWYELMFRLFPSPSFASSLQKCACGQVIFGPVMNCIFFAAFLMQNQSFSLINWGRKIRADLPQSVLAGLGFWPAVDLISFSVIPPSYIPLFVNLCSFIWTIYVSLVANQ